MKRPIIAMVLAILLSSASILYFNSCKKSDSQGSPSSGRELSAKINSWLDEQKPVGQPKKTANINLLKDNLDFSAMRYEQLNSRERFLIIPVKKELSELKKLDKTTIPQLLLTIDNEGNVLRGYLVLYLPIDGMTRARLPVNTFHNIYNNKPVDCSGRFRFLTASGRWLFEYEIKNGKIHSFGEVRPKQTASKPGSGSRMECSDWYLELYFWENGVLVNQTSTYLGTTCEDVDGGCDDPMYQTLCPDTGGANNGNGDSENTCCISDLNAQWTSSAVSDGGTLSCDAETVNPITGLRNKRCRYTWIYNINHLLFWTWQYKSIEQSDLEKDGNTWKFIIGGTRHLSEGLAGGIPPCIIFTHVVKAATPTISADRTQARMRLDFENTFKISCWPATSGTMGEIGNSEDFWFAS